MSGSIAFNPGLKNIAFDIREAAEVSGMSEREVAILIREGKLPAYRVEGNCLLLAKDIKKYIKSCPDYKATIKKEDRW